MKQMSFPMEEKEHRKFYSIKYSFIRQGELTISNSEVMQRLLASYIETHADEIKEIPDFTYKNYLDKGQRAADKRVETIKRKRGRPKKE